MIRSIGLNGKLWGESEIAERQRERKKGREAECCCKRVMVVAINLAVRENINN
jgi:hypothetical protein